MRWMLFLHISSVALWLGGAATLYVFYRKSLRVAPPESDSKAFDATRSVIRGILNPSALLVLFTGIGMMVQLGLAGKPKPFWLTFMEQFGGTVALASAAALTLQLRRLDRASSSEERARRWRTLNRTIAGVGAGVALTIFVVAMRF